MSDQQSQLIETPASPTNSALENTENQSTNERSCRVTAMPQDVRYAIDEDDRTKLTEKYNNYEISNTNACNIRFLTDSRQKKTLFGTKDEEKSNMNSFAKTFLVNLYPGYQNATKHSYKIFGTEANVRKCLVEIMNRMFKRSDQPAVSNNEETKISTESSAIDEGKVAPEPSTDAEKSKESTTEEKNEQDDCLSHPTSIFVTTINPDSSVTEEKKTIIPSTPNNESPPLAERKSQWTFILLISSQGQEALKKNWKFFADALQQRLNIIVANPVKLPKFGDKQVQNELSIAGESIESITDAVLQVAAFINDVLGVPVQPYHYGEEATDTPQDPSSVALNHQQKRPFFSRNRNGAFEQLILIRSDCVPRVVGTRAANLKRIQTKCHLRDMIVGRQPDGNGYIECTLSAYQLRNIHFAINTIRNFLRNEDPNAVLVCDPNRENDYPENSPHVHELVPPNTEQTPTESNQTNTETGFLAKSLNFPQTQSYPQPSYNFQNTPSFDFTHQATSASRKTDKRRGELHDHIKTPTEPQTCQYENILSYSPRHKSKRTCPETKEIDCSTDDGFWIQKQYYYALDDASKDIFDSLIDKLDKIRIATEENAAKKQQRLVGRSRCNKSKGHSTSIPYLIEANNNDQKELISKATQLENNIKIDQSTDAQEEKENKEESSNTITVNQN
ncbi:unnamed protein product [Adineta ricciae]|uniref:Uncharacterized protein n=1 Tax=Adineta ricciae TaxID=249248 RepID=A0A813RW63_ADIRI|nr:unnamed protein product [Adineta ricciae]